MQPPPPPSVLLDSAPASVPGASSEEPLQDALGKVSRGCPDKAGGDLPWAATTEEGRFGDPGGGGDRGRTGGGSLENQPGGQDADDVAGQGARLTLTQHAAKEELRVLRGSKGVYRGLL